jgi:hypothetical protein
MSGNRTDFHTSSSVRRSTTSPEADSRADRRISACFRWRIGHAERRQLYAGNSAAAYGGHVPIEDVAARDIAAGDVVRLDDLQAQRVLRAVHVDGQVMLELRPVGLEIWEIVRVSVPEDRLVCRLGMSTE